MKLILALFCAGLLCCGCNSTQTAAPAPAGPGGIVGTIEGDIGTAESGLGSLESGYNTLAGLVGGSGSTSTVNQDGPSNSSNPNNTNDNTSSGDSAEDPNAQDGLGDAAGFDEGP